MARVYTTTSGSEVWVSHYGPATEMVPCVVPDAVGVELSGVEGLRVEMDEAPEPQKRKTATAKAAAQVKED